MCKYAESGSLKCCTIKLAPTRASKSQNFTLLDLATKLGLTSFLTSFCWAHPLYKNLLTQILLVVLNQTPY